MISLLHLHIFPTFISASEPNAFRHVFNVTVSSRQLGRDVRRFRKLISNYPRYKTSIVVGPDITRPKPPGYHSVKYLKGYLKEAKSSIDAVTWHQ